MTTYKETFGKQIKQVSSDPTDAGAEGQIWFNTTDGVFKTVTAVGAWSSGGALPQVVSYNSGAGIQTAALSIGGQQANTSAIANTYEYDGSSWSDGGSIAAFFGSFPTPTSSYYFGACGTQTAAVIVGGAETNNRTVEYDGSSWTQTGNYPSQIAQSTMNGIQTAAINISGSGPPPGYTGVVANYNGSTWTASPVAFSPAGRRMSSAGTATATIVSGGSNTGTITIAQEWDGSSWTTVGAPSAPKNDAKSTGIQTLALKMYGTTGGTEQYNGSSWTTVANQAIARDWATGGGSNDSSGATGVMFGGKTSSGSPTFTAATEEFTTTIYSPIAATWASGGAYPTAILQLGGAGTQTAALGFGGNATGGNPNGSVISAEYNGSSWTSSGDLNQKGNTGSRTGVGTQTAALCVARRNDGTPSVSPVNYIAMNNVEEYNGSAWSNSPTLPAATVEAGSTGTTVAALYFGGSPGNPPGGLSGQSLYWNDTSWTATSSLNTSRAGIMSAFQGTYNASLGFGGSTGAPAYGVTNTELYNGSSWTNLGVMIEQKNRGSGHGTSTAALAAAGQSPSTTTNTQIWNGTSWATTASTATAQYFQGGGGSSTAAVIFAGADPSNYTTTTQEFTGEQQALDYKTLTSS